jgi:hypothetical protein
MCAGLKLFSIFTYTKLLGCAGLVQQVKHDLITKKTNNKYMITLPPTPPPIVYNMSAQEAKDYCQGLSTTGCYFPTINTILMNKELSKDEYERVYWHEIGHYKLYGVDLRRISLSNGWLDTELVADWYSEWKRGKKVSKRLVGFYQSLE